MHPNLIEETEKSFLEVAKLAFKDEQELKRSNEENFDHFLILNIECFYLEAFDDILFYAEKSLIYARDNDKLLALFSKARCMHKLCRVEEAALVH